MSPYRSVAAGTSSQHMHLRFHFPKLSAITSQVIGTLTIDQSTLWNHPVGKFEDYLGICYQGDRDLEPTNSTITKNVVAPDYIATDVNGDGRIGLAETIHSLRVSSGLTSAAFSDYVRKEADIIYDHEVDVLDHDRSKNTHRERVNLRQKTL